MPWHERFSQKCKTGSPWGRLGVKAADVVWFSLGSHMGILLPILLPSQKNGSKMNLCKVSMGLLKTNKKSDSWCRKHWRSNFDLGLLSGNVAGDNWFELGSKSIEKFPWRRKLRHTITTSGSRSPSWRPLHSVTHRQLETVKKSRRLQRNATRKLFSVWVCLENDGWWKFWLGDLWATWNHSQVTTIADDCMLAQLKQLILTALICKLCNLFPLLAKLSEIH